MQKPCRSCSALFEITDSDLAFYTQVSPEVGGTTYSIPPPKDCFDCRQQRRLAICNEFTMYSGKCALCNSSVITEFKPGHTFPIYCRPCYLSDKWDALAYGMDVDFSRPFFEQMGELFSKVPNQHLNVDGEIDNSEYIHFAGTCKNCYLIMHADFCEDCYYGYGFKKNRSCVDGFYNLHSELCYDCIDVHKSYKLTHCQDCQNCHSSAFLRDCIGCKDCFLCVGLRQKQYCIENQQLSKEDYEQRLSEINLGSFKHYQACTKRRRELELNHSFKAYQGHNTENCSGNYLNNCKNVQYSFDCEDVEHAKYCTQLVLGSKDNYDIYQYGSNLQQSYYCSIAGEDTYHALFSYLNYQGCTDLYYCTVMDACKYCFGCTNLRNSRYSILNKNYSKEEYETLVPKIIEHMQDTGEWGEFLPPTLSHAGYNESTAQLWYPLTKEQALSKGFLWSDYESPPPTVKKILTAEDLPDKVQDVSDDILECAIECEVTHKLFRLTKQEFQFYKDHSLPIPRRSWLARHKDRFDQRNPRRFFSRNCDKCGKDMQTTYSPDRPETVYCEDCYMTHVY